jgi:stringent starvation protein B
MVGVALTGNFMNAPDSTSTRPYLIRALYEWCTDNGLTPYVAVAVDQTVLVPREYVKNNEIVLNISFDATSSLKLGNDFIEFKARFAGSAREIMVPITHVIAIYARENGQGMAFPMLSGAPVSDTTAKPTGPSELAPASEAALSPVPGSAGAVASPQRPSDAHDSKFMQLVPESHLPEGEAPTDPPDPSSPPRGRTTLKRVK